LRRKVALKGRYVFPAVGEPIAEGAVIIQGEQIVAVGGAPADAEVRDLGNVAILPGLVNAHTHLDLDLGKGGRNHFVREATVPDTFFVDWLRSVVHARGEEAADPAGAVAMGLRQCLRQGTTTLGEIAQPGWSPAPFAQAGLNATVFLELIGPTPERTKMAIESATRHAEAAASRGWRPGLSPHAPYTVRPELLAAAVELSRKWQLPLAFHLAESREELELLRCGSGPFRDFLEDLGAWRPDAFRPGTRPLDYLRTLAAADRALVIHGNYLDDEEIAFLAEHRDRMAVVYCPRTHAWLGHDPYPLERMLAAGVTVGLGTDSRASSPDLSVLAEIRHVARQFPQLSGGTVLRLGTLDAARALGRERDVGSLEPGKAADLAVVALDDRSGAGPYELLFDSDRPVVSTWLGGSMVSNEAHPLCTMEGCPFNQGRNGPLR
jgi:cytosine/adenosine deaminase-related metal-dependent hydrolase